MNTSQIIAAIAITIAANLLSTILIFRDGTNAEGTPVTWKDVFSGMFIGAPVLLMMLPIGLVLLAIRYLSGRKKS